MQKHQEGYLVPLLVTSMCSSVLNPQIFWPKSKNITMRSICREQKPERATQCPANENDLNLPLHSDCLQTSEQQSISAAHLWPLTGDLPSSNIEWVKAGLFLTLSFCF